MAAKRVILELGAGNDLHGGDYTKAALRAVQDALHRLAQLVGNLPDWSTLESFLPEALMDPTERRAALASTLLAGLEMARGGTVRLHQEQDFGPILVRRGGEDTAPEGEKPERQDEDATG